MTQSSAPLFSVIIPLYNKRETIARALNSVLAQTVQDFEITVVNDGSTDGGEKVVEGFSDPRIRLIHQENRGVSAARNRGIAEAKAELIAFLDGDDEWLPAFLATIAGLAGRFPQAGLYATRYYLQNWRGERGPAIVRVPEGFSGLLDDYFGLAAVSNPPVCSSACCARKGAVEVVGGFPVGVTSGEDLLTWARIAVRFPVAYADTSQSVFCQTAAETCESAPSRVPSRIDVVGRALAELGPKVNGAQKTSFRRYRSLWHKMRASCFLRLGYRHAAWREIFSAIAAYPSLKLLAYLALSLMPHSIILRAFRASTANR